MKSNITVMQKESAVSAMRTYLWLYKETGLPHYLSMMEQCIDTLAQYDRMLADDGDDDTKEIA